MNRTYYLRLETVVAEVALVDADAPEDAVTVVPRRPQLEERKEPLRRKRRLPVHVQVERAVAKVSLGVERVEGLVDVDVLQA